eukprot:COSAG06_NODE_47236_length_340_cov_1.576763_1_plen_108_part_01
MTQECFTAVEGVDVRLACEQPLHRLILPVPRREMQRRLAGAVRSLHVRVRVQKQLQAVDVPLPRGVVQRGVAVAVQSVDILVGLREEARDERRVALARRLVELVVLHR